MEEHPTAGRLHGGIASTLLDERSINNQRGRSSQWA
jgi:hypothetical protein